MEIYVLGKSGIYLCGIFKTLHQEFCVAGNPWWDWWCCERNLWTCDQHCQKGLTKSTQNIKKVDQHCKNEKTNAMTVITPTKSPQKLTTVD